MKLRDVVVIGAGPVGSYIAYLLADAGYGVVVLEQRERVGEQVCCTGVIGQECASLLGIDGNVILRQVKSARLFSPSGKCLRLRRQETQAYVIDRAAFDVALAARAQSKAADFVLSSAVRNIEVEGDRVRVEVAREGKKLNFEARAVVVATGYGSRLVEGLGLGGVGDFAVGAQAEVETRGVDEIEVFFGQEVVPGFFGWIVPTSPNRALVGLLTRQRPGHYLRKLMASLLVQGRVVSTEAELSYGGVPLKPLPRTYGERLVVVGDAGGQVKPTTGGGIYFGLLCAGIAANTLCRALETNDLSARALASYERKWKRKLGRELRLGYWARRLYGRLSDKQIDKIFGIVRSSGIDEALLKAEELSFDWHSEAMLRLMGYTAVSRTLKMMKPSSYLTNR